MLEDTQSLILRKLFACAGSLQDYPWAPFRDGVEIHRLYGGGPKEPAAALLRYASGATVPQHFHEGYEHILILSGEQSDEHGVYPAGTLLINPPGSMHSVVSTPGCVVLAIWQLPIRFAPDEAT